MGRVYTGWRAHVLYACVPLHESAVRLSECIYAEVSVAVCVGALLTAEMVCGDCLLVGCAEHEHRAEPKLSPRCIVLLSPT